MVPGGSSSIVGNPHTAEKRSMNSKKMMVVLAAALLLAPLVPLGFSAATLTIGIGPKYYNPGNTVKINGTAPGSALVALSVNGTAGVIWTKSVTATAAGKYSASYPIPAAAEVGIYTVTAKSGVLKASTVFLVTTVSTTGMATEMIDVAEKAKVLAFETIQSLKAKGMTILPAVNNSYTHGVSALDRAKTLLASGNGIAATESAKRALTQFRNAMSIALKTAKVESENKQGDILTTQADRLAKQVATIQVVVDRLKQNGYTKNVTVIQADLNKATSHITTARSLITAGKYNLTIPELKAARDDLQSGITLLKDLLKDLRHDMMDKFKLHLNERITAAEDNIGKMGKYLSKDKVKGVLESLGNAKGLMNRAGNGLNSDDDETADDLNEASQEVNAGVSSVGNGYGQGMRQANLIRAQIQVLQEMAVKLEKRGQDTSDITAKIDELQSALDQATTQMMSGNAAAANSIMDAVKKGEHGLGMGKWKP